MADLARRRRLLSRRPGVFLSSTSDLVDERACVREALSHLGDVYGFEYDIARRESPEHRCRSMIVTSNLFVCVVGDSYGTLFPGAATPTSVVEWEFETARAQSQLEIMTFVRAGAGAAPDVRQQQFVERITRFREGVWAKHFTDVVELGVQVRESVGGWLSEYWARTQARKEDLARRYRWPLRMVAGTVTASVVTAVVGGVLTPAALAALCVVTGALIGACFVLELLLE